MGYRIDSEGYNATVAAVQAGSTSSGASVYDDGERSLYRDKPDQSRQDLFMNEGLRMALIPADEIRDIRPMQPIVMFPDEGIAYDRQALTIAETLDAKRWEPNMRSYVSGTSKPRQRGDGEDDAFSGSLRNVSTSVNPM